MIRSVLQPGPARWTLLMFVVSLLAVVLAGSVYVEVRIDAAERRIEERERQQDRVWCALLNGLDRPLPPEARPDQRLLIQKIHEIRVTYGCVVPSR